MYCLMAAHVYIDLWTETGEFLCHIPCSFMCFCDDVSKCVALCVVRGWKHDMAMFGSPGGGSVSQSLQRSVQTAAAAPLLSSGSFRACRGPLLQPGCQACTAWHHRVGTNKHLHLVLNLSSLLCQSSSESCVVTQTCDDHAWWQQTHTNKAVYLFMFLFSGFC